RKKPPNSSTATITTAGVEGVSKPQARRLEAVMKPFQTSTERKPKRRITFTAVIFMTSEAAAVVKVKRPETKALMPKVSCSMMGSRKGVAIDMRNSRPPQKLARKVG